MPGPSLGQQNLRAVSEGVLSDHVTTRTNGRMPDFGFTFAGFPAFKLEENYTNNNQDDAEMKTIPQQFYPLLAAVVLWLLCSSCDQNMIIQPAVLGRVLYGVDTTNSLVRFGSMSSGAITNRYRINGLQSGEIILGIDFRPIDQRLYALGSTSRIYVIDTTSGVAIQVGANAFSPMLAGSSFGFDFNPVPDRIRLHSDGDQDLRLNPDTGGLAARDSMLAYSANDLGAGFNPNIVGTAYTNSVAGATVTTLFGIDSNLDVLVTLPLPNNGQLFTVGTLGVNISGWAGFDISGRDGMAFAALFNGDPSGLSGLYTINLSTGMATLVGWIGTMGTDSPLRALAIAP